MTPLYSWLCICLVVLAAKGLAMGFQWLDNKIEDIYFMWIGEDR